MLRRLPLAIPFLAIACAAQPSEDAASSDAQIHVEEGALATSLTELKAGLPYLPGVDESPLAIGEACIKDPTVSITPGQVGSTASVVQTRDALSRELGFSLSGTIPVAGGITGAAGLSINTSFDNQSAVVLFQSTGTYDSVLTGASALANYDATQIGRCGYGYVARATHRVTAAMVVTVRSTSNDNDVKANVGLGKTGVADAKVDISNLISKGQVEISIHFATDVIPNLPTAPFADSVLVVGTSDADKQNARTKLDSSLGWLASAQSTIESYLLNLRNNPDTAPPAPTQSIQFRYYPGMPLAVRNAIDNATTQALATRTELAQTRNFVDGWTQYESASKAGSGYEWNIPLAPLKTVADLDAKKNQVLGTLQNHQTMLEDDLDACTYALRNDPGSVPAACPAPRAFPVDTKTNDIRHIAFLSVDQTNNSSPGCPSGQRYPTQSEAPIFAPWSKARASVKEGIWMDEGHCTWSQAWIYDGAPGCGSAWTANHGIRICLDASQGPMPSQE